MKVPKKILSIALCTLLSIGGSQLTLLRANAQDISRSSTQANVQWQQGIRFRLRDKNNHSNKKWLEMQLTCRNRNVTLEGDTYIEPTWIFDDVFIIGISSHMNFGPTKILFKVGHNNESASVQLKKAKDIFNNHSPIVGDDMYIHGLNSTDSFEFSNKSSVIKKFTRNKYTSKYDARWDIGFKFRDNDLYEEVFSHTPKGVELASKEFYSN